MSCPICEKEHPYTIDQALASMSGAARRLERITAGLSGKKASTRPAPHKWSAKEIVCHLADCELVYGVRYRSILSEPEAALVPFDQEAWAHTLYQNEHLKDGLAMFKAIRRSNVALLRSLPPSAWDKAGKHPDYGALTLRQIVTHLVDHDRNHIAQVKVISDFGF